MDRVKVQKTNAVHVLASRLEHVQELLSSPLARLSCLFLGSGGGPFIGIDEAGADLRQHCDVEAVLGCAVDSRRRQLIDRWCTAAEREDERAEEKLDTDDGSGKDARQP
jgi:hypothetical protein